MATPSTARTEDIAAVVTSFAQLRCLHSEADAKPDLWVPDTTSGTAEKRPGGG